ncbi:hypothetical protein FKG94_19695 [Exilibacterium tricleocarpae]|uniref:Cellobiose 2-epimerase n=1 Tax=Exilibacterium tricleocarpae TaxID=2591008 RepID=A0A545T298_9GAMM|nr:AGE family epimerase/isomerase [Exilibacterium tricleocarpae]TQV71340.1 hypothetical protein FKG94_19695 [Exilibacterium tricleocarpae]
MMMKTLRQEFRAEMAEIGCWWADNALDVRRGGFVGAITHRNDKLYEANKGVVQNARILWFFSELARVTGDGPNAGDCTTGERRYSGLAERAYDYFIRYFCDPVYGGVYWELNCRGEVVGNRKQIYAQAFAIYGLTSYYRLTACPSALSLAEELFGLVERYGRDPRHGGYLEAFSRRWASIDDMRLSEKDMNAPKTMNTHLHVLEAYTSLYRVAPSAALLAAIENCLECFRNHILSGGELYLRMYMDLEWNDLSDLRSFGHDIEASWLIWEALEVMQSETLKGGWKDKVVGMARQCLDRAVGDNGEIFDAMILESGKRIEQRVWWVQAEALVGFLAAFRLTGDGQFLHAAVEVWRFIRRYQKDPRHGEWLWFSRLDRSSTACKMGPWKGPYHNGRAMMEAFRILQDCDG